MSKLPFEKGRFLISALTPKEFPQLKNCHGQVLPDIVLIGRSNVGKSSLINALIQNKSLAKTSSTPGKTQRINFFMIDEQALLVDLPGYGYSKAPKAAVAEWSRAIDAYLHERASIHLILLLIDIRREAGEEEMSMIAWAIQKKIPLLLIFTKRDKIPNSQVEAHVRSHLSRIATALNTQEMIEAMAFSSREPEKRKQLIYLINKQLTWD